MKYCVLGRMGFSYEQVDEMDAIVSDKMVVAMDFLEDRNIRKLENALAKTLSKMFGG